MKKSLFLIVLTALLCLVCALALTACEEEPEAPAPVCQHRDADDNALCDKCNESYTDGLDVVTPPGGTETPGGDDTPAAPGHTHTWGAWIETTAPTCTTQGIKTRTCACGQSETQYVDIDSNAHIPASAWTTDGTHHWKVCTRTGCTAQLSKTAHTSAAAWSSDATNHWKNCTVCGYDIALAAHTYDAENTCMCGDYKDKGVRFTLSNGTYKVNYYSGAATEVVIPATYKGVAVTGIAYQAFYECSNLTSVTIPASVTSIDSYAFYNCSNLTSVTISEGVTSIGDAAFSGTGLTTITIPASVTSIGKNAFRECSKLTTVEFGANSQLTSISNEAFYGCTGLTSVTIPASVTSIGDWAFSECSYLTTVTIPASVTSIGYEAFDGCSRLTSVTIPAGVTSIGYRAFDGCSNLTTVTFANPNGWWRASYSTATGGTAISAADLSNKSTAATYLRSTYCGYYWKRT